jgi:hypothetical protein
MASTQQFEDPNAQNTDPALSDSTHSPNIVKRRKSRTYLFLIYLTWSSRNYSPRTWWRKYGMLPSACSKNRYCTVLLASPSYLPQDKSPTEHNTPTLSRTTSSPTTPKPSPKPGWTQGNLSCETPPSGPVASSPAPSTSSLNAPRSTPNTSPSYHAPPKTS